MSIIPHEARNDGRRRYFPKGGMTVNIELTDREFRRLLDMVYIGNWVLNSARGDNRLKEFDDIESKLFGLCLKTGMYSLFEVVDGQYELTGESARIAAGKAEKKPVMDWITSQGRYKHLLQDKNAPVIEQMQAEVDRRWNRLIKLTELD